MGVLAAVGILFQLVALLVRRELEIAVKESVCNSAVQNLRLPPAQCRSARQTNMCQGARTYSGKYSCAARRALCCFAMMQDCNISSDQ